MRFVPALLVSLSLIGWTSTAQAVIPASERQVLLDLYASTNGASWTNNAGWNGPLGTECSWYGVSCDTTQSRVTGFYLGRNNLVGTLPSLSGLTALQRLGIGKNQLTGPIPSLSGLTALEYFFTDSNQLTGSIPSLSGLTALLVFDVYNNQLTGPVPAPPTSLLVGQSNLCGNSLVSSGNPAIDAAWVTAQYTGEGSVAKPPGVAEGQWLACQTGTALADCLFNWAESTYPTLFAPPRAASITVAPWYYRYYSQTDAYLGTSSADNHVYYKSPATNYSIVDEGAMSTWLTTAGCQ